MELQVGVKVVLRNPEGKCLLLRRSEAKYGSKKWDIPGGRIEPGTVLADNLARELMEETGLTMASAPRLVAAQDIFSRDGLRHVVRVTYVGTGEGEPVLSEEHTEYRWMSDEELRALGVEELDKHVKELLDTHVI